MKQVFGISVIAVFVVMLAISVIFPAGASNSDDQKTCAECGNMAKEKTQLCFEKEGSSVKCNILYHQEMADCDLICRQP